jgi:hypothetical protein
MEERPKRSFIFQIMISRDNQVWLYVIVLMIAAGFGLIVPDFGAQLDARISFIIAILIYSMFSQISFTSLNESRLLIVVLFGLYSSL